MIHGFLRAVGSLISRNKLSILIYHQVLAKPDPMRPSEPDAETFRWQMQLLKKHFCPIGLTEAVNHLEHNSLPKNAVCVTFDDGYLNNLEVAQPILQAYRIPATVYVATAFSNGCNMWNDRLLDLFARRELTQINLDALEMEPVRLNSWEDRRNKTYALIPKIKYQPMCKRHALLDQLYLDNDIHESSPHMMTAEQIRLLCAKGIEIGAHTVDHPILKVQSEEEQIRQITESKNALENLLQQPIAGFAYPNGKPGTDYDSCAVRAVKKAGFAHAVSTQWGVSTPATDKFQLNRFTPWDATPAKYHARLIKNML